MRRIFFKFSTLIALICSLFALMVFRTSAQAQAGSAYDIIDAVNSIRTSYGHPALEIDSTLMATAQGTAEVMASTGSCAHIGNVSGRVAAAGYGSGATVWATENIACGYDLSVQTVVYQYWSDTAHMLPMTHGSYVHVGAGVAIVDGKVYYVLHAAYSSGNSSSTKAPGSSTQSSSTASAFVTRQYISPVVTSTPNADGSVVHEVKAGQALWSIAIAYGVKIVDLLTNNKLPENAVLTIGQKLIVFTALPATASPTVTPTRRVSTRTPTPTWVPRTATPSPTPSSTPTATTRPLINWTAPDWLDDRTVGIVLIVISAFGLLALMATAFRKK